MASAVPEVDSTAPMPHNRASERRRGRSFFWRLVIWGTALTVVGGALGVAGGMAVLFSGPYGGGGGEGVTLVLGAALLVVTLSREEGTWPFLATVYGILAVAGPLLLAGYDWTGQPPIDTPGTVGFDRVGDSLRVETFGAVWTVALDACPGVLRDGVRGVGLTSAGGRFVDITDARDRLYMRVFYEDGTVECVSDEPLGEADIAAALVAALEAVADRLPSGSEVAVAGANLPPLEGRSIRGRPLRRVEQHAAGAVQLALFSGTSRVVVDMTRLEGPPVSVVATRAPGGTWHLDVQSLSDATPSAP